MIRLCFMLEECFLIDYLSLTVLLAPVSLCLRDFLVSTAFSTTGGKTMNGSEVSFLGHWLFVKDCRSAISFSIYNTRSSNETSGDTPQRGCGWLSMGITSVTESLNMQICQFEGIKSDKIREKEISHWAQLYTTSVLMRLMEE